jgi:hypothetical protein
MDSSLAAARRAPASTTHCIADATAPHRETVRVLRGRDRNARNPEGQGFSGAQHFRDRSRLRRSACARASVYGGVDRRGRAAVGVAPRRLGRRLGSGRRPARRRRPPTLFPVHALRVAIGRIGLAAPPRLVIALLIAPTIGAGPPGREGEHERHERQEQEKPRPTGANDHAPQGGLKGVRSPLTRPESCTGLVFLDASRCSLQLVEPLSIRCGSVSIRTSFPVA